MSNLVHCPHCNHPFEITEALSAQIKQELETTLKAQFLKDNNQMAAELAEKQKAIQKQLDEQKAQNEQLLQQTQEAEARTQAMVKAAEQKLAAELQQKAENEKKELENRIKAGINAEYDAKLKALEAKSQADEAALAKARDMEVQLLQQAQAIKQREEALALETQKQVAAEREKIRAEAKMQQEQLTKLQLDAIKAQMAEEIALKDQQLQETEKRMAEARKMQLEMLEKERQLEQRKADLDLEAQQKAAQARTAIEEQIKQQQIALLQQKQEEFDLKLREKDEQMKAQMQLIETMKQKAEQGSMQAQGEVQEIILQEILQNAFPFDLITEVEKGIKGADCKQHIRNKNGTLCGTILYESKRTKAFNEEWIEKLKKDQIASGADIAIIVTQTMPQGMEKFGEKNGVWICPFSETTAVVALVRNGLIQLHQAVANNENKGEKMLMLYNYLVSTEFLQQWNAVQEGYMAMKQSIDDERNAMEKLWKKREKQLEKIRFNANYIQGSIEGIAGAEFTKNLIEAGGEE